jgi:hypothetical protein
MDSTPKGRKLFLIVEDNELCAKVFVDLLKIVRPSVDIRLIKDAIEAFKFAKKHQPDAIHVDCQLPEYSGMDFLAWCGAVPRLAAVPKMMVTCFFVDFAWKELQQNPRWTDPLVVDMLEGGVIERLPPPAKYFRKPTAVGPYIEAASELLGFDGPRGAGDVDLKKNSNVACPG